MNTKHELRAGAGRAEVRIDSRCLPVDGFTAVRDPLHVRALILDGKERVVIVSVEITSLFPPTQACFAKRIHEMTGATPENIWLCLTHSFSGPHIWPADGKGPKRSEEELACCKALEEAYLGALEAAVEEALQSLQPALVGHAAGSCEVNASRNVETDEGWWLGTSFTEPCDHSLPVLRIDSSSGTPIALLFVYGIRSCVMSDVRDETGQKLVSSDLCGAVSNWLEQRLDIPALFLCGACGDQEPAQKGSVEALLSQSDALGSEVLALWRGISEGKTVGLRSGVCEYSCPTKKMNRDLKSLRPTRSVSFEPDGDKTLRAYALHLGDFHLVGVQPEIDGVTAVEIAQAFPEETVAVAVMVNGSEKCMPEREGYEKVKYQSLNSPFMPGSAEILRDKVIELINTMKEECQ